jgi:hypothetical protein
MYIMLSGRGFEDSTISASPLYRINTFTLSPTCAMTQGEGKAAGFARWIYVDLTLLLCCESEYMYLHTGIITALESVNIAGCLKFPTVAKIGN